jgi:hypothetical protein
VYGKLENILMDINDMFSSPLLSAAAHETNRLLTKRMKTYQEPQIKAISISS